MIDGVNDGYRSCTTLMKVILVVDGFSVFEFDR